MPGDQGVMVDSQLPLWVVVGDIHLHAGSEACVAQDLARLVRDVTAESPDAWVVMNGDVFDLDRVRGEPRGGVGAEMAAARLARILETHATVVDGLASHVSRGGTVVFVAGNHDAELLLAPVRDVLLRAIGSSDRVHVVDRWVAGDRVVEHGHQADPDSAFHPDPATALAKSRLSAFPLASLITRALLSHIPRFELAGHNHSPPLTVLLRVLRDYGLRAIPMILRFPIAGTQIVGCAALAWLRGDAPRGSDASMGSPWRVARRLYLDRYMGTAIGLLTLLALAFGLAPPWLGWPVGLVAVALAIPPSRRKQFAHRDVRMCAGLALQHTAHGARIVVLGHTHRAFLDELEGGAVHANHGAFSSCQGQPRTCERSYLRISPDGRVTLHSMSPETPTTRV
jgi:UDP-2,3-diacylglucosamine pyrophosphatase LpxH